MKMSYPLKSKEKRPKAGYSLFIAVLFLVFVAVLNFTAPNLLRPAAQTAAKPFLVLKNKTAKLFQGFGHYMASKRKLASENIKLKRDLERIYLNFAELETLKEENLALKEEFGREKSGKRILAYVLKSPGHSPYDTFILDTGEKHGVKKGDKVYLWGSNAALGYIEEVFFGTSLARLYSSPGEKMEAELISANLIVTLEGRGGGNFEVKLPKNVRVAAGDLVGLPGYGNPILGAVGTVDSDITQSLQQAVIRSLVNVQEIDKVFISIKDEE